MAGRDVNSSTWRGRRPLLVGLIVVVGLVSGCGDASRASSPEDDVYRLGEALAQTQGEEIADDEARRVALVHQALVRDFDFGGLRIDARQGRVDVLWSGESDPDLPELPPGDLVFRVVPVDFSREELDASNEALWRSGLVEGLANSFSTGSAGIRVGFPTAAFSGSPEAELVRLAAEIETLDGVDVPVIAFVAEYHQLDEG